MSKLCRITLHFYFSIIMSETIFDFLPTPTSKRTISSSFTDHWPSKRRRMSVTERSFARSTDKPNPNTFYWHPNAPLEEVSPPSPTQYMTPPDSCELPCSSPLQESGAATTSSSSLASEHHSNESTSIPGSLLDLVPALTSFPVPPYDNIERTPSPVSNIGLLDPHASSEACTPAKVASAPVYDHEFKDTFGNRPDVERIQLSHQTSLSPDESAVARMLIPRSAWGLFTVFPLQPVQPKETRLPFYRGRLQQGRPIIVRNEDLWMDEKNPFLLTRLDLDQGGHKPSSGTLIPTTSSLHLLSNSSSGWI